MGNVSGTPAEACLLLFGGMVASFQLAPGLIASSAGGSHAEACLLRPGCLLPLSLLCPLLLPCHGLCIVAAGGLAGLTISSLRESPSLGSSGPVLRVECTALSPSRMI